MKHIKLANQVIEMLLKGEDEVLVRLRSQMENVKSISEESSTVGFYINYEVDKYVIDISNCKSNFQIGDVDGCVDGIKNAVGFVLYINNGFITCLEGYTILDSWPDSDSMIELEYDSGENRNYISLRNSWIQN
ncbi:MAG: hypothetical protein ACLU8W_07875 [Clostridia bacterium]